MEDPTRTARDTAPATPAARSSTWPSGRPPSPPLDPLELGILFDGKYRVRQILGEGTMGVVVRAHDETLQREVALKRIHPEYLVQDDAYERFLTEARAMARVRHPNVVEIHAFGEVDEAPYFVMEYVAGTNLESELARRQHQPMTMEEGLRIMNQVCRGVAAVHASGTVHRDLKPSNILIEHGVERRRGASPGPRLRVAVADMGLAQLFAHDAEDVAGLSGTPAYMAPEAIVGQEVPSHLRTRADVYSLGVLAYEILTGKRPFHGGTTGRTLAMHVTDSPQAPSQVNPRLPKAFDAVILEALAKDPARRIGGAEAFRRGLIDAAEVARAGGGLLRILVVDDDGDFRMLVSRTLAKAFPSATIEAVGDGETALEVARRNAPDLVLTDLDMPRLDGMGLVTGLRETGETLDVPIIVATGIGASAEWQELSRRGANAFLVKPVDPAQLVTTVEGMVGRPASWRPAIRRR